MMESAVILICSFYELSSMVLAHGRESLHLELSSRHGVDGVSASHRRIIFTSTSSTVFMTCDEFMIDGRVTISTLHISLPRPLLYRINCLWGVFIGLLLASYSTKLIISVVQAKSTNNRGKFLILVVISRF